MINYFSRKLNKKGFTLAELLIVVAIIAVLVAVAVPIFMGSLEKARVGVHKSNARSLKSMAIGDILASAGFEQHANENDYYVAVGTYDFSLEKFEVLAIKGFNDTNFKEQENVDAGHMYAQTKKINNATTACTSEVKDTSADEGWCDFETSKGTEAIGKIPTSRMKGSGAGTANIVYYRVVISATDITQVDPTWA